MWRNNVCKNYLIDKRVAYKEVKLARILNRRLAPPRSVLERGMSSGGLVLGGQCIMMDSLTLSRSKKCIESLTTDIMVDFLLHWLDPDSALIIALTVPSFYQVYKDRFPQPISLNRLIRAIIHDPSYWTNYHMSVQTVGNHGALDPLRFNFWYPGSHYIYYSDLKITTDPDKFGRHQRVGRFLSREVFAPDNTNGSISLNEPSNVALKKLKQRYLQWGMYSTVFLRLTGVPLEYPHNLGERGWNSAVMEMLQGLVATMDKPGSLLQVKRNEQLCFPWPARLRRLMGDDWSIAFNEWIEMVDF